MSFWQDLIYGTDTRGEKVTYQDDKKGGYYISDGWKKPEDFWGNNDNKGHDHGDNQGDYKDRGQYTG